MQFNEPLVGNRIMNYRFFYCTGAASLVSLLILFIVTGYTAYVSTHIGHLMTMSTEVLDDIQVILPDVHDALHLLEMICHHENFTKHYGNICT